VFMSATEAHNLKNTNKTVAQSLGLFTGIVPAAKKEGLFVRGYLSTIWGCPYEGKVDPKRALEIARKLRSMGCDELSLGDTIGDGNHGQPDPGRSRSGARPHHRRRGADERALSRAGGGAWATCTTGGSRGRGPRRGPHGCGEARLLRRSQPERAARLDGGRRP